jgi:hypothetical protein
LLSSSGALLVVWFLIATFFIVIFFYGQGSQDARRCWFPDKPPPFIGLTKQLKRRKRVARISFDPQHLGNYLKLLAFLALHFKPHAASHFW